MGRTATITLGGNTYTLCYSTRVLAEIEETGVSYRDFVETLADKVSSRITLLAALMRAGYKYDRDQGKAPPEPMTEEELLDNTYVGDQAAIYKAIMDALKAGTGRKTEARAKSKKDSGATQAG